jgi:hypothetical protein
MRETQIAATGPDHSFESPESLEKIIDNAASRDFVMLSVLIGDVGTGLLIETDAFVVMTGLLVGFNL